MRTAFVAPFPPYRGGIARHSAAVARALSRRPDVELTCISFAKLYPQFFYPGASDREDDNGESRPAPSKNDLNTLNPLSWRRLGIRLAGSFDSVVMPAWNFYTAPCLGTVARIARKRGCEIVMIVRTPPIMKWRGGKIEY